MAKRTPTLPSVALPGPVGKPAARPFDGGAKAPLEAVCEDARWRREIVVQVLTETLVCKRLLQAAARQEGRHAEN